MPIQNNTNIHTHMTLSFSGLWTRAAGTLYIDDPRDVPVSHDVQESRVLDDVELVNGKGRWKKSSENLIDIALSFRLSESHSRHSPKYKTMCEVSSLVELYQPGLHLALHHPNLRSRGENTPVR
jgi:hypothetical protein